MRTAFIILVSLLVLTSASYAQLFGNAKIADVEIYTSQDKVVAGSEFEIAVVLKLKPGLHINANKTTEEFLIPTVLKFSSLSGFSFGKVLYPKAEMKTFAFSEQPLAVYDKEVILFSKVSTSPSLKPGTYTITGIVSYQGCNDNTCFAPTEDSLRLDIEIVPPGTAVTPIHQDIFSQKPAAEETIQDASATFTSDELKAKQVIEKGLPFALIFFFGIGLALNLTPCVYPVIPLTVSYFGGQSTKSRGSSFVNALFYLLGIALAFAALGLISGLAGKQWGFLFQSPWFVVVISTIILAMAASMFGAFEITVPPWLMSKLGASREGIVGALIMGLTAGVVIAPCAAGIIIGLVGLVAKLGLVARGALLFFVMGLGLGLPYLVLATFSGLLNKLPQSGMWMVWVRKFFGILLIGVALYFILPQLERLYDKLGFLLGLLAIFGGLLLGFLDHESGYTKTFKIVRGVFGIIMIVLGISWTNGAIHAKPSAIDWIHYEHQTIEELATGDKPIFMDFYADWCAPCKQLDRETFTDARVVELAKSFIMIKVDCTAPDESIRKLMQRFNVTGMPTLIFLSKSGQELTDLREIGFVGPDKFVQSMQKALEAP